MSTTLTCPISRARLVAVNVRDPDAAIAFWRDKIGFTVQSDAAYGDGDRWIEVIPPGAETGLTLVGPANQNWSEPEDWSPALFACDDIDRAVTELSARGVEFTGPVMRMEGGAPPMAFFLDQDRRRFLLTERTD
jgi:catechol 2,3-dioxygenase-like lactoylglutathione lyase family enzyme